MPRLAGRKPTVGATGAGRAVATYNALRLALLVGCLGIGWLVGLRGVALIVVALLVSGVLSWFLLRRQRIGMGVAVEQSVARGRARLAERTAQEDAYVDALLDRPDPPSTDGRAQPDQPRLPGAGQPFAG